MEQGMHDASSDDILDDDFKHTFFEPKDNMDAYAPKLWQRALHGILDGMIFFWLTIIIFLIIFPGYYETEISNGFMIAFYFIAYSWWFIFEFIFQKTPSKFLTKTKVVDLEGAKPSIAKIFIRTIARFIPFEFVSFLMGKPYGWHDSLSNTRVVKDNFEA
ncbi:MAG: RDD family protein [Chitinophagales bacterium]